MAYLGAFQHVMKRGYNGNHIFDGNKNKSQFLDYLEEAAKEVKINLFAYSVLNNHEEQKKKKERV
jgi:endonuclease YncB( thermonuclease family)